ncbi:hypothetical protein FGO68_gene1959 [Halteria grandinella]|uniref:OTU domain-containing protein n=1 Tax=Halteria grandinella TaxID=5974 RepID=A0A8J8P320_HALGN|nr:hypothetical protein FGO68_gene1959 [Halteria grandinella]
MIERDRTWGGELEMSILSKQYQCAFVIHANGRPNIAVDSCEHIANKQVFHLAYHLGEHYNCVVTLDQLGNVDEQPSAPNVSSQYETPQSSWWYWIMTILSLIGPYLYMNYYK